MTTPCFCAKVRYRDYAQVLWPGRRDRGCDGEIVHEQVAENRYVGPRRCPYMSSLEATTSS